MDILRASKQAKTQNEVQPRLTFRLTFNSVEKQIYLQDKVDFWKFRDMIGKTQ